MRPAGFSAFMTGVLHRRSLVFLLIAIGGCAVDLATKNWMFHWLGAPWQQRGPHWLWPHVLGFETSLNEGALFGVGQGMVLWFAVLSMAAATGVLYWFFLGGAHREWLLACALGAILAGICGNLYDRLGLHGLRWDFALPGRELGTPVYAVRDWILVMLGQWQWPNFNIADSLLVSGAILLLWHAFWQTSPAPVPSLTDNGEAL